tara:strand:- start:112 stop:285 length:174 start_codon:yes stop_codon:yes gene_type:complete
MKYYITGGDSSPPVINTLRRNHARRYEKSLGYYTKSWFFMEEPGGSQPPQAKDYRGI